MHVHFAKQKDGSARKQPKECGASLHSESLASRVHFNLLRCGICLFLPFNVDQLLSVTFKASAVQG